MDITLDAGLTYSLSFDYSDLTANTNITNVFTSLGVGENTFAVDLPVQKAFTSTSGTQVIVFTPTESQLRTSKKLWCRFIRTATPQTVSINISNVEMEVGVKDIDETAFDGCGKLSSPGLTYRLLPNTTNQYAVTGISSGMSAVFCGLSGTLFIPSVTNDGKQITQIDPSAFANKEFIKWVFMQSGISTVGNRAFQFCSNLKMVNMSATSVTRIEAYTFDTCQLGKFYFPSNLTYVGEGAFIRAGLTSALPDSVTYIGNYAFAYREDILGIRLPNNLYEVGNYAFAGCGDYIVTNIDGTGLQKIGNYAFYNTKLYNLTIPSTVTNIGKGAFKNSNLPAGFTFKDGTPLQSIGEEGFANNGIEQLVLPASLTAIGRNAFSGNSNLTIYTGRGSKPSGWHSAWNSSNRPVVWGCTLSSGYVVSFVKSTTNPTYSNGNNINNPKRTSYNFAGWYVASDYSGDCYWDIKTAPNGRLYAKWVTPPPPSCIAEGTLVTLADGSQVAVEDLTGDENLLVWNMLTGQFDSAPILFIDSDPYTEYEIIHLHFSDGTEVKVIYEHAFWDFNLNRYVFMRNDAAQYIGHWFNKQTEDADGNMIWTQVQLVDVDIYNEYTTAWSPVTYSHFCLYVNGMLSMPGATEGLINIFEVDSTTMQYDMDAYYADIEEYGLFTYEEFNELIPVPEVIFDAFNGQYLKVSIGKGLITIEELRELVEYYAPLFPVEDVEPDNETEEDITVEEIVEEILDTVIGFFEELMNYFGWAGIFAI